MNDVTRMTIEAIENSDTARKALKVLWFNTPEPTEAAYVECRSYASGLPEPWREILLNFNEWVDWQEVSDWFTFPEEYRPEDYKSDDRI